MKKIILNKSLWVIIGLSLVCIIPSTDAFAWGWSGNSHRREVRTLPARHEVVAFRSSRYHYWVGGFFRKSLFGYIGIQPPFGIVVAVLPFGHQTIFAGRGRYYCYDNVYYKDAPNGYVVVPAPAVNSGITSVQAETIVINVPNANGSYTAVTLVRSSNGYIGPQGEFYPGHPSVEQLRVLYAR